MRLQREQFRVARASMKHCMGHGEPSGCVAQWRHSYLFIRVKGGDEIRPVSCDFRARHRRTATLSLKRKGTLTALAGRVVNTYRRACRVSSPVSGISPVPRRGNMSVGRRGARAGRRRGAALSLQYRYRNAASSLVELVALRAFSASISPSIRSSMSGPRWPPLAAGRGRCRRTRATACRRGVWSRRRVVPPACRRRVWARRAGPAGAVPSPPSPAGSATVRRVLVGSCRATVVAPCACRIAIGVVRSARRSAFDARSTLCHSSECQTAVVHCHVP